MQEGMLVRTLQVCKPCTCPALRPKKEPGDSNRDISGLLDRDLKHLQQGPGACVQHTAGSTWQQPSLLRREGGYAL